MARLVIAALLLLPAAAPAQEPAHDASVARNTIKAAGSEIRCTFYQDRMVRETGTDTPGPDDATLVPGGRPPCSAVRPAQQIVLKTPGYTFAGRKGPYLLFTFTDPNGAIPFFVVNLAGKVLYSDGTDATIGIRAVTVENGALHIVYRRGFNADCSLMKDAAGCWSKLVATGKIPRAMAGAGPTSRACAAAYGPSKAVADSPSLVAYDVDMTVDASGKTQVTSRGAVICDMVS